MRLLLASCVCQADCVFAESTLLEAICKLGFMVKVADHDWQANKIASFTEWTGMTAL